MSQPIDVLVTMLPVISSRTFEHWDMGIHVFILPGSDFKSCLKTFTRRVTS